MLRPATQDTIAPWEWIICMCIEKDAALAWPRAWAWAWAWAWSWAWAWARRAERSCRPIPTALLTSLPNAPTELQASGFNLQYASHDVILYSPLYNENDPVSAVATEQQAIGRCFRLGATKPVTVHRIVVRGPAGEESTDDLLLEYNTDEKNIIAAAGGEL